MSKKCRLIWDDCTPTRERRPTTTKDVEEDVHVVDYASEEEMFNKLLDLTGFDEDDLELDARRSTKDNIEDVLSYFDDPSDGSPNILYASIDGKELEGPMAYDSLDGMDLENVKQDEVIEAVKGEFLDEDDTPLHFDYEDIINYLWDNCKILPEESDPEYLNKHREIEKMIKIMADEIYDLAYEEAMWSGSSYETVEEIDIPELCDASSSKLHYDWYKLVGLDEDE